MSTHVTLVVQQEIIEMKLERDCNVQNGMKHILTHIVKLECILLLNVSYVKEGLVNVSN